MIATISKLTIYREQIIKLQSYLGEMPTMEEHYSLKEQVTELHSKCISLTEALNEKDQERKKLTTQITENVSNTTLC